MKLKDFLLVCEDTNITIEQHNGNKYYGTEYKQIHDILDCEIDCISTLGYDHIIVMLKELKNEEN